MTMHVYFPRNAHFDNHYGVGVIRRALFLTMRKS